MLGRHHRTAGQVARRRVIANFVLGISKLPGPTRYFTVEAQALEWLKGKHEQR